MQQAQGRPREQASGPATAGDRQPVVDIRDRLPGRQSPEMPAQRDPLIQLCQLGIEEQLPQLRLPDQDDAEQLAGRGLEVE